MDDTQQTSDQGNSSSEFEAAINSAANQTNGDVTQSTGNASSGGQTQTVKVGGEEFTPDQLAEYVKKGKVAKEWESVRPGYDLDSLYADYTKKSQELAEVKRRNSMNSNNSSLAPEDQAVLDKAVEPLIEKRLQKERDAQAVELFRNEHPELKNDAEWNKYSVFFDQHFVRPFDPKEQLRVFDLAFKSMNFDTEVSKQARQNQGSSLAQTRMNEMASVGGGGKQEIPQGHLTPEQMKYVEMFGMGDYAKSKGLL